MVLEAVLQSSGSKAKTDSEWAVGSALWPLRTDEMASSSRAEGTLNPPPGSHVIMCLPKEVPRKTDSSVHTGEGQASRADENSPQAISPVSLKGVAMPAEHMESGILHVRAHQQDCLPFSPR